MVIEQDVKHRFLRYPNARGNWVVLPQLWALLSNSSNGFSFEIQGFTFMIIEGIWYNWVLRNEFLFDGIHGVQQIGRFKGKWICQFFATVVYECRTTQCYNSLQDLPCHKIRTILVRTECFSFLVMLFLYEHAFTGKRFLWLASPKRNDIILYYNNTLHP